jgi:hypothetical protein
VYTFARDKIKPLAISRSKRFFRAGGGLLASVLDIGWHSTFAAPRTKEPAGGFVLQSPVDAN